MSPAKLYFGGVSVVALVAALSGALMGGMAGQSVWLALGVALVVQGPMGWWLVRSIGTPQVVVVWTMGMLARLASLALVGLLLLPALHRPLAPGLLAMAVLLVTLLGIEIFAVWTQTRAGRE